MKIRKNGKVINLTESDLRRITKRVISEEEEMDNKNISECKESHINQFMKSMMGNSGNYEFIIKNVPGKKDFLILVDPNKKECYCRKEDFAVANGI